MEGRKNYGEVIAGKKYIVDMLYGVLTDLTVLRNCISSIGRARR